MNLAIVFPGLMSLSLIQYKIKSHHSLRVTIVSSSMVKVTWNWGLVILVESLRARD
jgi:hypothetical protein